MKNFYNTIKPKLKPPINQEIRRRPLIKQHLAFNKARVRHLLRRLEALDLH